MTHGAFQVPTPVNEPVWAYAPGSPEKQSLKAELARQRAEQVDIPLVIGGEEFRTGDTEDVLVPHDRNTPLGVVHRATPELVQKALDAAEAAREEWIAMPWQERAAIFLRAGELLAGPWRDRINAATMLGQSKTVHQAEIDAACELIDFWRFNAALHAEQLYA